MAKQRYHLVTIGGEERRLRFGRAPLLDAQKLSGRTVGQLFSALLSLDLEAMQVLLWAALRTENSQTSYNKAGEILDQWMDEGADLITIQETLNEAAVASGLLRGREKESDEEEGEEAPKASKSGRTK